MAQSLELRQQATEVVRLAGLAQRHFEVWRVYTDQSSRDQLFDALDQFPDFVNLDQHAHQELCLLYLGSLFEKNDRTINLDRLIAAAAAGHADFQDAKVRAWFEDAKHLIAKIHLLRNNAIAHRSASLSRASAFARAGLSPDDLRQLVNEAERIAYAIGHAFGVAPFTIAVLAPTDLARLFKRLLPTP